MSSSTSAAPSTVSQALPDYLPARMINEFVYCPRLFYYEQVKGVFVESADTIEGSVEHRRVDTEGGPEAPPPGDDNIEPVVVRSMTLSSEAHKVIAKLDLTEFKDGIAIPVDYKHGRPMSRDDGFEVWPQDRMQLAVQALVLRANGLRTSRCDVATQSFRSPHAREKAICGRRDAITGCRPGRSSAFVRQRARSSPWKERRCAAR
jgi:CRISPR-associated protein Cas1